MPTAPTNNTRSADHRSPIRQPVLRALADRHRLAGLSSCCSRFGVFDVTLAALLAVTTLLPQAAGQSAIVDGGVKCDGSYPGHLQGICLDDSAIFWSFTTWLVKTDLTGKLINKVPVADHHGDLCLVEDKLYVAVNLGKFNDPRGNADSWVYVYDAESLQEIGRHEVQQVFHGAGGIGYHDGYFYVVGGLPADLQENYVYQYDRQFQFQEKHVIASGHTRLGIQTAAFAHDRWWFGCYGSPKILLVTDADFKLLGRYEFDCSLGIAGVGQGRLLVGSGVCKRNQCTGAADVGVPDPQSGIRMTHD